jgi:hypothetical protein
MAEILRTVTCPFPGFEGYAVTYNMMATVAQVQALSDSMGQGPDAERLAILDINGWPENEFPGGPFGDNAPMIVLIWTLRTGYGQAMAEYVNDPFSVTG